MSRPQDPDFLDWLDEAFAAQAHDVLRRVRPMAFKALRRAGRNELVGPCPRCVGTDRFSINTKKNVTHCRHCGLNGGPVNLVMELDGVRLVEAAEIVTGRPPPDREGLSAVDRARIAEEREKREAERVEAAAEREREEQSYREAERRRCWRAWCGANENHPALIAYHAHRGLELPPGARLRYEPAAPYFVWRENEGRRGGEWVEIYRGPAQIAAIIGPDGRFAGMHRTWIDPAFAAGGEPAARSGKAEIFDPKTGEICDAKKSRGSKSAGRIELVRCEEPPVMVWGEGIETVLSLWCFLRARGADLAGWAFQSTLDLGNLGGKHKDRVRHPTLKVAGKDGVLRPARIPGPEPDRAEPAIPLPDSVERLILIGDADCDRFLVETTFARAAARYERPGLTIEAWWAPDGNDMNDGWRRYLEEAT